MEYTLLNIVNAVPEVHGDHCHQWWGGPCTWWQQNGAPLMLASQWSGREWELQGGLRVFSTSYGRVQKNISLDSPQSPQSQHVAQFVLAQLHVEERVGLGCKKMLCSLSPSLPPPSLREPNCSQMGVLLLPTSPIRCLLDFKRSQSLWFCFTYGKLGTECLKIHIDNGNNI